MKQHHWVGLFAALLGTFAPTIAVAQPSEDLDYNIYGYLRVLGSVTQNDPQVDFIGRNDGFALQSARLGFDAEWKDRVSFKISADGATDERDGANAINGRLRFALKDAYADVKLVPAARVRVGQFYSVFDIDEIRSNLDRRFVDLALESRGVRPTQGWETPGLRLGRSLGIAVRSPRVVGGEKWALGYEVAMQNGTPENISVNDNDSLAYTGSLLLGLRAGTVGFVGVRHNRRTEGDLPFLHTEDDLTGATGVAATLGKAFVSGQVFVRQTTFVTTGGPTENAIGGHVEGAYRIGLRSGTWIEPAYRFALIEPSDLIPNDVVQEHTAGVNVGLEQLHTRVLMNFTHVVEESGRVLDNDRFEGVIEVSF